MFKTRAMQILVVVLLGLALALGAVGAYAAVTDDDDSQSRNVQDSQQGDDDSEDSDESDDEDDDTPKAWIGILAGPQDDEDATGIVIRHVVPDSPADEAGLEQGDVITAVDDNDVDDISDIHDAIADKTTGDEVTLTVTREDGEGDSEDVTVTLGEAPAERIIKDFDFGGLGDLGGLSDLIDGGFEQFLGGTFRYEDGEGNPVTVEVVPGTVVTIDDGSITLDVNGNEGNTTFDLGDEVDAPGGLAEGDDAIVVLKDGEVSAVLPGLGKLIPGIPGIPGFGPGRGFHFNDENFDPENLPNFDDFRDWFPDLQPQEESAAPDA